MLSARSPRCPISLGQEPVIGSGKIRCVLGFWHCDSELAFLQFSFFLLLSYQSSHSSVSEGSLSRLITPKVSTNGTRIEIEQDEGRCRIFDNDVETVESFAGLSKISMESNSAIVFHPRLLVVANLGYRIASFERFGVRIYACSLSSETREISKFVRL